MSSQLQPFPRPPSQTAPDLRPRSPQFPTWVPAFLPSDIHRLPRAHGAGGTPRVPASATKTLRPGLNLALGPQSVLRLHGLGAGVWWVGGTMVQTEPTALR